MSIPPVSKPVTFLAITWKPANSSQQRSRGTRASKLAIKTVSRTLITATLKVFQVAGITGLKSGGAAEDVFSRIDLHKGARGYKLSTTIDSNVQISLLRTELNMKANISTSFSILF